MTDLLDEFGLACPQCGQAETLHIPIFTTAELTVNGSEDLSDHEWDDESFCSCPDCGHSGKVAAFRTTDGGDP